MKKCNTCGVEQPLENFNKEKLSPDGVGYKCKPCKRIHSKIHYAANKEVYAEKKKVWNLKNKEYISKYNKLWNSLNKERVRKYDNEKYKTDPKHKLKKLIKVYIKYGINCILKEEIPKTKTKEQILGCSFEEFKQHLESQFQPWMNWDNHGKYNGEYNFGWDIDHITPISSAKNIEDIVKLNHFSNLQPLCSKINRDVKRNLLNFKI